MASKAVIDWLLGEDQPAIRYRALTELLGRPQSDPDVRAAKKKITQAGWAASILAERNPGGWWVRDWSHFTPTFTSTTWMLLVLSDLGLTRESPEISASCELWMKMKPLRYGPGTDVPDISLKSVHLCSAGIAIRALVRFGYGDDPKIRRVLEWFAEIANPKGGWSHFGSGRNLDSWHALGALAALPRSKRSAAMQRAAENGAEYFLGCELHKQGDRYEPWYRFHYPVHYYYDILVGLDLITSLGYGDDHRLRYALSLLKKKRRSDGKWVLDAIHPDVEGSSNSKRFALEKVGEPSKMITLIALKVLDRVGS